MPGRPIIALLTDFGLRDHYVGVLKGVIAGICPDALIIDITHDIPPQDVRAAAFELEAAWPFFPSGTVFVAVVDPGVGTDRRAIAARLNDKAFVGPDNGSVDLVFRDGPSEVVELSNAEYARVPVSHTFAGRDRFAPAAAWLARGVRLSNLGPAVTGWSPQLYWPAPRVLADGVTGEILHVDRFGNLITNIGRAHWPSTAPAEICVGAHGLARVVRTYGDGRKGELIALFGSTDRLEVAVASGSAAAHLGLGRGGVVRVPQRA